MQPPYNADNLTVGSFFVAVPLSSYKSPELNKAMYSGLNSIGADIFVDTQFGTGGVVANSLFDYYIHNFSLIMIVLVFLIYFVKFFA